MNTTTTNVIINKRKTMTMNVMINKRRTAIDTNNNKTITTKRRTTGEGVSVLKSQGYRCEQPLFYTGILLSIFFSFSHAIIM